MYNHVQMFVSNIKQSTKFYTAALKPMGIVKLRDDGRYTSYGIDGTERLWLEKAGKKTVTTGVILGFPAASRKIVGQVFRDAVEAGGKANGEPGLQEYSPGYYAAYILDPDGNTVEAVTFGK